MRPRAEGGDAEPRAAFVSAAPLLTKDDVERFCRQMLVEEIGAAHMESIRRTHVVCVGAGGLGSTILLYLAAAGVGRLTVVDFDDVEVSNLHRQVIHASAAVGRPKAVSARESCLRLCPTAHIDAAVEALCPANAERLCAAADVVVDGTDNVAARYLINDAAMRCGKPLISGSAMGWDGQLSVYGYRGGPCYRCLFPQPPPPETVGSCNDSGVMGPLPGMIGCLQALEVLKVATGVGETLSGRLFLFNGLRFTSRIVQLRARQPHCAACGAAARMDTTALADLAASTRPEYVASSCSVSPAARLGAGAVCSAVEFASARCAADHHRSVTLDVRMRPQYDMAHLPDSVNVPYRTLQQWRRAGTLMAQLADALEKALPPTSDCAPDGATATAATPTATVVYVVCRRGINSVHAVALIHAALQEAVAAAETPDDAVAVTTAAARLRRHTFRSVTGGLNAYHREAEPAFPYY
ncbi:molybdopterin synthase sulfurylase-like protein [Novymonas esmeraldas]|uniref:Molybdopterin synthase sulfurylase-like protein n=1 Tax=Novymonas esmeraldas TaxID=1808958 RepID=A0AAW0ENT0_9TRYP